MPIFEPANATRLSEASLIPTPFPMPLPLLADISGAQWIAISAILGGLTFAILLIFFGLKFVQRRQELWHETARVALEKGQPLPPLPRDMQPARHEAGDNDLRTGLVTLATGAGLYLFFAHFLPSLKYVAAIPGFVGAALLIYALFKPKPADRSPES